MSPRKQFVLRSTGFLLALVPFALLGLATLLASAARPRRFGARGVGLPRRLAAAGRRMAEIFFPGIVTLTPFGELYYRVAGIKCPRQVRTGEVFEAQVSLRNLGGRVWDAEGGPYPARLGTWNPENRESPFHNPETWPRPDRPAGLAAEVKPGGTGVFKLVLRGPGRPGRYTEELAPVADGLAWFAGERIVLDILVEG